MSIAEARERMNYSKEYCSRRIDVSISHWYRIEGYLNIPNVVLAQEIASFLGQRVDNIFSPDHYPAGAGRKPRRGPSSTAGQRGTISRIRRHIEKQASNH